MGSPYAILSLVVSLTVAGIWLIDSIAFWWRVRVWERLYRWGVLLLLLGTLFLPSWMAGSVPVALYYVPITWAAAFVIWFGKIRRRPQRFLPDQVLFRWTSLTSFLLSGAVAGVTLFLAFAAAYHFQSVTTFAGLLLAAAALGTLLAGMKRQVRQRQPDMMAVSPKLDGGLAHLGLYADECIMFLLSLPMTFVLGRYALFGGPFLPWIVYLIWSALQASWLRWTGTVDTEHRMLAMAHELLLRDDYLCRWLPELEIQFDRTGGVIKVSGKLPSLLARRSLAQKLSALGTVDVSEVECDPRF
ncbi:MAG: hypothetical protein IMX00_10050 [Limnochordales bacterium]|nr:hypothetical protein [Limnochordales bacterium]